MRAVGGCSERVSSQRVWRLFNCSENRGDDVYKSRFTSEILQIPELPHHTLNAVVASSTLLRGSIFYCGVEKWILGCPLQQMLAGTLSVNTLDLFLERIYLACSLGRT